MKCFENFDFYNIKIYIQIGQFSDFVVIDRENVFYQFCDVYKVNEVS